MDVKFSRESFDELFEDIKPLLTSHWKELALYKEEVPLDPDFERYRQYHDAGIMQFFTARIDGKLIGYSIYIVSPRHLHYSVRVASNDIIWVHPDHRNIGVGNGLFDFVESELAKDGPVLIHTETKEEHPQLASLLTLRGHKTAGRVMLKRIG